ncbi:hypothetical protein LCGC14_2331320 [marine sediment metagenome]|uniref:Uncharacterized protein n=1 Tax=marine sediment metagenome TaxID=412755 RepID=A0A0F9ESH6_9ZZZZ
MEKINAFIATLYLGRYLLSMIEYFRLNIEYLRNSINFKTWKFFDLEHEKWPITGIDHGP